MRRLHLLLVKILFFVLVTLALAAELQGLLVFDKLYRVKKLRVTAQQFTWLVTLQIVGIKQCSA